MNSEPQVKVIVVDEIESGPTPPIRNDAVKRTVFPGEKPPFKDRMKVGRNEPCPCGSALKFKKCCGRSSR